MPTLVAEEGQGEQAATEQDGNEHPEHGRDDRMFAPYAHQPEINERADHHQDARNCDPLYHAPELQRGLFFAGDHT